ncbi:DNA polymerase III subunit gamma/tau [Mycoplasmopsis verecunda]|uniref:DNA polymerase III subunit gamma/tau n=1 Tax=Mycoplasmopsis verecunda TaxID=171291 RepID=A0A1T4L0F0_9BACT|nr:DNA polymerase III subunit gamma/tau [Mycoplasmopsis verecunda]WPB54404.1 DNA polymerase III subunit gamma/tau [Mycoplasmopsis verecunda]SJZ48166.1 DNA polymerase-3 subunit gamma/tau [Mycoplasmopsis verecunda]
MSYKTLYRKYRPKTFEEVVGQNHVVKTLQNIIATNKIGHAYLFCGPKGTGKTSVAKIFANVLNCSHKNNATKACDLCLQNFNDSLDIIEMDAASNNGVDEIRDLKEKIEQAPINSKYKIYIIDEVHMLTKSAFNALLKTLEEPPMHSIFILATTDVQKVPLTIRSRVQSFNFNRMSDKDIITHVGQILDAEGIKYELEALRIIARLSSGGMRDGLSIADQASAFNSGNITADSLYSNFGIISTNETVNLMQLIISANAYDLVAKLNDLEKKGIDPNQLTLSLISFVKEKILYLKTKSKDLLSTYNENELNLINIKLSNCFSLADALYDIFVKIQKSSFPFEIIQLGLLKALQEFDNTPEIVTEKVVHNITSNNNQNIIIDTAPIINNVAPAPNVEEKIIETVEELENDNDALDLNKEPEINIQQHTTESILNLVSSSFKFDVKPVIDIDLVGENKEEEIIQTTDNNKLTDLVDEKVHAFLNAPNEDTFLADKLIKQDNDESFAQMDLSYNSTIENNNKAKTMVNEMLNQTREFLLHNNDYEGDVKDVDAEIINEQLQTGEKENLISTREIDINKLQDFSSIESNEDTPLPTKIPYKEYLAKRTIEEYVNDARWIQSNPTQNLTALFRNNLNNIDSILYSKPEFNEQAALFKQIKIMFGSERFIVVTSNKQNVLDEIAEKGDSEWMQNFITYLFGQPYKHIYPISYGQVQAIQEYIKNNKDNLPPIVEPDTLDELARENNDEWFIKRANLFR